MVKFAVMIKEQLRVVSQAQAQHGLEHTSIQTAERYLALEHYLTDAPCDHLGIRHVNKRQNCDSIQPGDDLT